ncbi:hypothetical protein C1646_678082 [Rhizophagus diaphanus]|nr:hypothetical protein C1646_678082 [Rhizophagus diaphanus] [Rhizophagus sp. MUCL 43196]
MADIYDALEEIKNKHEIEKHKEPREEYQIDPSCLRCYRINEEEVPEMFKKFWKVLQKVILKAMSYNKNTIEKCLEYVKLTRKEEGERYHSKKKRSKELIKIREKGERLIDVIIASIRYRNRPDYRKIGIASVIKVICEHYVFYEDNNMTLDEKVEENLLGNKELLKYGYIIEDDELDMRFTKFEEWLEDTKIAIIKDRGYNTMKYFKEILHMEESIAEEENREKVKKFQKSITYKWDNKHGKIWESDEFTDMIIIKIIKERGFIEEYNDVEELISSDDTELEDLDEHHEMILRNYWIENVIKELNNEEIVKELKKWYNMNIIECPLCQKMILIKEAVDYNKEVEGRICKSCFEKEEDNNKIEVRMEKIMKICERAEIKITREEIIQVLKMGYEDKEIVSWGFIKLFQENKNE